MTVTITIEMEKSDFGIVDIWFRHSIFAGSRAFKLGIKIDVFNAPCFVVIGCGVCLAVEIFH